MAETLVPELTFGRYVSGMGIDASGLLRRLIWIVTGAVVPTGFLLLEDGFSLLLEDSSKLLLE